ncbi:hypothetical protein EDB80DRAFT_734772, partial [Ilyonectria destructans]
MLENFVLFLRDTSLLVWSRRDIYSHISKKAPWHRTERRAAIMDIVAGALLFLFKRLSLVARLRHFRAFSGVFGSSLAFSAFSAFAAFLFVAFWRFGVWRFGVLAFGVWRLASPVPVPVPVPVPLLHDPL